MSLSRVMRPGHIALRVLDLGAALYHYTEVLGLIETDRDEKGRVYLKAWDEHDHHSVVLRQAETPGMDYVGFKVDSQATLDQLAKAVSDFGCKVESIPAGEHK
ncbi:MAG: VOC family protein, partial [Deltaproteobacteria bacterium]|nr:VOC family protein [Deltaproteobacteria bacterium]